EVLTFARQLKGYQGIVFEDVTQEMGLTEIRGSRIAWGDFNGDGRDDLLAGGNRLLRNDDTLFTNVTEQVGINAEGAHGGVWGDFDGDGWVDLFCFSSSSQAERGEKLYRNRGDGTFEDLTDSAGVISDTFTTEAAIWVDLNNDKMLDLYVASYEKPAAKAQELGKAYPDRALIQIKPKYFVEQSSELSLVPPQGALYCGRSPVACDFDFDGDQDLYVGNYRLQRNLFFINEAGSFSERAAWYQIEGDEVEGWFSHTIGSEWGDFDGDGDFDLIVGNLAHPRYIWFSNRTMLYRNDGPHQPFTEVRREWRIRYDECHSEPVWGDFDNDGDLDLFITSVYPNRRSYLYANEGGYFTDVTYLAGARYFNGWGCATADYNNDGKLDLALCSEGKVILLRNITPKGGNWLEIDGTNLQIGDVIKVVKGDKVWIRQVEGGKGAGSQNSATVHIGLGREIPDALY
ncbi:MAG: CRTAC1 family protein, partial [bacterium]